MPLRLTAAALLILTSCNAGQTQPSLFAPGVRIALPSKPSNVELADLNKDGRLDLIVASDEAKTVMVMMGEKGDLPFRAATARTFTLAESPGEIAVGDVNGDGRLDLALDHHDSYNVTLLLGDANGSFSPAPNSPIVMKQGQHPHTHGLGMGDFNGDGKLDLATVNNEDNDISVALGDGRGGFTNAPQSPFAVGPSPYPLTLADVNTDGRLDIVSNSSGTGPNRAQLLAASRSLTLLIGDGQGGFKRNDVPLRTGQPWFAAVGDLNGDRKPDIVATHHDQSMLTVLLGDGAGGFREIAGSPVDMGHNVWRAALADVNGDKRLDVIAAGGDSVRVMLGDGAGNFKPAPNPYTTAPGTWRVVIGDLNQDNKPDIVTSNTDSSSVTVLLSAVAGA
ncbi:MAG TPA: VCBS repeat-containing protein [Pyrinomonadaceae bacterium]|nr:VCBS repeat-containing protein [Pyrinomonadaceae bacterium]